MAYKKVVKGQYGNQIKTMLLILLALILIAIYWLNFGKENYVKAKLVDVSITAIDGDKATGKIDHYGDVKTVSIKLDNGDILYSTANLKFREGGKIKVWYSKKKGYTLYNPNTLEYDSKYYGNFLEENSLSK